MAHIAHNAARAAARGYLHDERGPFLNAGLPYLRPEAEGGGRGIFLVERHAEEHAALAVGRRDEVGEVAFGELFHEQFLAVARGGDFHAVVVERAAQFVAHGGQSRVCRALDIDFKSVSAERGYVFAVEFVVGMRTGLLLYSSSVLRLSVLSCLAAAGCKGERGSEKGCFENIIHDVVLFGDAKLSKLSCFTPFSLRKTLFRV